MAFELRKSLYVDCEGLLLNDTFVWVALVCQDLENVRDRGVKKTIPKLYE